MSRRAKCKCAFGYCCDACWAAEAKSSPCQTKGCRNPRGHGGECGPLRNTQSIAITAEELMPSPVLVGASERVNAFIMASWDAGLREEVMAEVGRAAEGIVLKALSASAAKRLAPK